MNLVDRAFILWERTNQPRRARARLFAVNTPSVCTTPREPSSQSLRNDGKQTEALSTQDESYT